MPPTKRAKPGRTENQVLSQVIEAAAMLGLKLERRNTGAGVNPSGKTVRFGTPGDSDLTGVLPGGRRLDVEVKHEGFDPSKLRSKKREHFERQLSRLREVNALGGVGFWVDDATKFLQWMRIILDGGHVEERGDGPLIVIRRDEQTETRA